MLAGKIDEYCSMIFFFNTCLRCCNKIVKGIRPKKTVLSILVTALEALILMERK